MKPFSFPIIGVDISDESFKFLRLEYVSGRRELAFFGVKDLPKGIVEAGEIMNPAALAQTLKDALKRYRSRFPYLAMSLPEEKGFLRVVRMQRLPIHEIRQALEFQLEEHIPYPPADLIFDFQIIGPVQRKNEMQVVIMAYPREIIESYMLVARNAGFLPVIFELESQAVARAVVPRGSSDAVLVGDIGRTRTTFSIIYRGAVHFTSTIKVGGKDIDAILMESLHITESQASDVKIGRGFDYSSEDIIKSLTPALGVLKDEAVRQVNYWEHKIQNEEPMISRVILCGGDAHLKGLPEYLARELGLPVERARIWENLFDVNQYVPSMNAHITMRYATVFGLALRGDEDLFS
jgi:type IV pilus assembly protein PilM